MLSPLPIRRPQVFSVISTQFYIPDKRMGAIQESFELFQIDPISSLPLLSLGRNSVAPGWLILIFTHLLVSLGTPAPASGVLHLQRDMAAAIGTSWAHKCSRSLCEPSMPQTHPCTSTGCAKLAEITLLKASPGIFSQHVANATASDSFLWFKLVVSIAGTTQLS